MFQRFRTGLTIDINTDAVTTIIIAIERIVEAELEIARVDLDEATVPDIRIDITIGIRIITITITITIIAVITILTNMPLGMLTTVKPTPIAGIEQLIITLHRLTA